jgi:hypothetical protein
MSGSKTDYLIGVFQYFDPFPEEERGPSYYLLYLLDQKGVLEKDEAVKIFQEKFKVDVLKSKWLGPFDSLDDLNQFAFFLCEKLDAQKISLLSVQEYNTLLEQTLQASDFHRDLLVKGNVFENIDKKEKGFFKKLFRER